MNFNTTIEIADINTLVFPIDDKLFIDKNIKVDVLRLDRLHKTVSGNKWYKLKYFIKEAIENNCNTIITYGGVWSNHIIATAAACNLLQLKCIAYIRSDEKLMTKTLQNAIKLGMQITFISREEYKVQKNNVGINKNKSTEYFIPEGGMHINGINGAKEIVALHNLQKYSHLICPVGTGTTFAGIVNNALPNQKAIGMNALKGGSFQLKEIMPFIYNNNFEINNDYHFGGFAKCNDELISFMNIWYDKTDIPTDFIYTAKMFYGILDLINKDFFIEDSHLLIIHTGGLQGNLSLPNNTLAY